MPQLIESLNNLILSEEFCSRHKESPNDFIRKRLLPFHSLICLLLNMNNQSYQNELDRYFKEKGRLEKVLYHTKTSTIRFNSISGRHRVIESIDPIKQTPIFSPINSPGKPVRSSVYTAIDG